MLKKLWNSCKKIVEKVIYEDDDFYYPETLLEAAQGQEPHSTNRRIILAGALEYVANKPLNELTRKGYLYNEEDCRKEIEDWIDYLRDTGRLAERIPVLRQLTAATMLSFTGLLTCGDPLQKEITKDIVPELVGANPILPLKEILGDVQEAYGKVFGSMGEGFSPKRNSLSDMANALIVKLHNDRMLQGMKAKATLQP